MLALKSYIICGTPRSGSTLLCDLLASTGVAGRPASYFRRQSIPYWAGRQDVHVAQDAQGPVYDRRYLDAVIKEGKGESDIFGLRLMWESVAALSMRLDAFFPGLERDRDRFEAAFGPFLCIHLSRTDKVAQAVSRVKAIQTGLWHVASDGTERERTGPGQSPTYDRDEIGSYVAELEAHDRAWAEWFERNCIEPLPLTYEALSKDPRCAMETVLSALQLDTALAVAIEPRTRRMSDFESENWASRFRDERGVSPI